MNQTGYVLKCKKYTKIGNIRQNLKELTPVKGEWTRQLVREIGTLLKNQDGLGFQI